MSINYQLLSDLWDRVNETTNSGRAWYDAEWQETFERHYAVVSKDEGCIAACAAEVSIPVVVTLYNATADNWMPALSEFRKEVDAKLREVAISNCVEEYEGFVKLCRGRRYA